MRIDDQDGTLVPRASNKVRFSVSGPGDLVAVDNGDPTSFAPFHASEHDAFNGLCIAIVRTRRGAPGKITLTAQSDGARAVLGGDRLGARPTPQRRPPPHPRRHRTGVRVAPPRFAARNASTRW